MNAIGFIETVGLVGAIEAADAMLKAADVRLLEKNLASGGLVTITVLGEVSAVKAAVDAAVASISRISGAVLFSQHVIARPDAELSKILLTKVKQDDPSGSDPEPGFTPDTHLAAPASKNSSGTPAVTQENSAVESLAGEAKAVSPVAKAQKEPVAKTGEKKTAAAVENYPDKAQLSKMTASKLQQLAKTLDGISIPASKISSSDKKTLIDAILKAYRQREE